MNDSQRYVLDVASAFYFDQINGKEFEKTILFDGRAQEGFGEDIYQRLASIEYGLESNINDAKQLILTYFGATALARSRALTVLDSLLNSKTSLAQGCQELFKLRKYLPSEIPIEFEGFESEIETYPTLEFYRDRILACAKTTMVALKS